MKKDSNRFEASVTGAAVAVAVCAALGGSPAHASQVIVPVNTLLGSVDLDFDLNGTPEYTFSRSDASIPPVFFEFSNNVDTHGNGVAGYVVPPTDPKPGTYASLLHSGELIDGSLSYQTDPAAILSGFAIIEPVGDFYGQSGFAALRFSLPGETGVHFGWAELHDSSGNLTVVRAGYETAQDTGIVTPSLVPEPGSLALLAAGAAALLASRRRKQPA